LLERARQDAFALIQKDPDFTDSAHRLTGETLGRRYKGLLEKVSVG